MKNNIVKAVGLVTIVTVIGKLLGFGRETVIAAFYGASAQSDVYFVAAVIPTLLFAAISMAITTGLVPIYIEERNKDKAEASRMMSALSTFLFVISVVFIALCMLFAPWLTKLFAPGFTGAQLDLAVDLTLIMLPSFCFFVLSAIATGVLNANKQFFAPAMVTIPSNLIIILFTVVSTASLGIYGVAIGTLIGAVFQFLIQYPQFRQHKIGLNFSFKKYMGKFKTSFIILLPVIVTSITAQINEIINRVVASGLPEGSISALNYSNKLMYLPLSVIAMSIITVLYPSIVQAVKDRKDDEYSSLVLNGMRTIIYICIPIVLVMTVSGRTVVEIAFQRGAFDAQDTDKTTYALIFYMIGLIFVALREYFIRCVLALDNSKILMVSSTTAVAINITLSFVLSKFLSHGGVALGFTISMLYQAIVLGLFIKKNTSFEASKVRFTLVEIGKMAIMTVIMIFALGYVETLLTGFNKYLHLTIIVIATGIFYVILSYLFKIKAFQYVLGFVKKKKKK